MNLLSTAFAFIFIAIVALASFWLKEEVINEYKNFMLSKNSGPSFFLKDFDSTKTDEDGNLQSSLRADYMKHFKEEEKTSKKEGKTMTGKAATKISIGQKED